MSTPPITSVTPTGPVISVADARQETYQRLANIAIGQQVQGKVLSKMTDGTHLVNIGDTAARVNLPNSAKTGDTLFLTLIRNDPRPTFLMTKNIGASPQTAAQATLQQNMTGTGVTTSLSAAGKLIESLAQSNTGKNGAAVISNTPIVSSPQQMQPNILSSALQQTLQFSGVFYESHLAQWTLGKRSLEDIKKEPQAKFGQNTTPILQNSEISQSTLGHTIQSQLATLEQQKFTWQGEIWPGQNMHWEVNREEHKEHQEEQSANEEQGSWQSKATFRFPGLGEIAATLHLTDGHVRIHIDTDQDASKNIMIENQSILQDRLADTGLTLDTLVIHTP